jgi:hypothetical protein
MVLMKRADGSYMDRVIHAFKVEYLINGSWKWYNGGSYIGTGQTESDNQYTQRTI